eukprot:2201566-Rhodomonas_salina.1
MRDVADGLKSAVASTFVRAPSICAPYVVSALHGQRHTVKTCLAYTLKPTARCTLPKTTQKGGHKYTCLSWNSSFTLSVALGRVSMYASYMSPTGVPYILALHVARQPKFLICVPYIPALHAARIPYMCALHLALHVARQPTSLICVPYVLASHVARIPCMCALYPCLTCRTYPLYVCLISLPYMSHGSLQDALHRPVAAHRLDGPTGYNFPICLRPCYQMPGTDLAYCAVCL